MLSGMKAMTGPICRARNLFLFTKNIITYLFILQMRKYFMQRIEQKWIENWTSLFCAKLDFWRGRSDTAAPSGHGFHNHHVSTLTLASDVWPRDIWKYTLRPIVAAFLGRSWENMKTSIDIHMTYTQKFGTLRSSPFSLYWKPNRSKNSDAWPWTWHTLNIETFARGRSSFRKHT